MVEGSAIGTSMGAEAGAGLEGEEKWSSGKVSGTPKEGRTEGMGWETGLNMAKSDEISGAASKPRSRAFSASNATIRSQARFVSHCAFRTSRFPPAAGPRASARGALASEVALGVAKRVNGELTERRPKADPLTSGRLRTHERPRCTWSPKLEEGCSFRATLSSSWMALWLRSSVRRDFERTNLSCKRKTSGDASRHDSEKSSTKLKSSEVC